MKIVITPRLLEKYPDAKFIAILAENFSNEKSNPQLEKEKVKIMQYIRKHVQDAADVKRIAEHRAFHTNFGKSYPIEFQIKSLIEGKDIPTLSTLTDVLFMTEMKHYCIISGHSLPTLYENLIFDLSDGETYVKINGKSQKLKTDDIVLKQEGQVITSLLYGPDDSTKITNATNNCLYLFWFASYIDAREIKQIVNDFKNYLKLISNKKSNVTSVSVSVEKTPDFTVTPWEVKGDIDYDRLVKQFGVKRIDDKMRARIKKICGEDNRFLRRDIFFAHMYFDKILDAVEKGETVYMYTGRAPSGPVHFGHIVPWIFAKWLQDAFGCKLIFQIPDEEKMFFKEGLTFKDTEKWTYENILDIIAVGFDPKKTMIIIDTKNANLMYKTACQVAEKTTASTAKALFGLKDSDNVGKYFYSCMQSVPAFLPSILEKKNTLCFIPCAIDQDVHFRLTRDVAPKIGYPKPSTILCRFLPALGGSGKLNSSGDTMIAMTDDPKTVRRKIMKYAFSGGKDTVEEHRKHGGNTDIDVAYQWLTFFEPDDKKLAHIKKNYESGKLLSGELKQLLVDRLVVLLEEHQERRKHAKKHIDKFLLKD